MSAMTYQRQFWKFCHCGGLLVVFLVGLLMVPTTGVAQAHCNSTWGNKSSAEVAAFREQMQRMGVYNPQTETYRSEALGNALIDFVAKQCPTQLQALDDGSSDWLVRYVRNLFATNGIPFVEHMPRRAFEARYGGTGFNLALSTRRQEHAPTSSTRTASASPARATPRSQKQPVCRRCSAEGLPIGALQPIE